MKNITKTINEINNLNYGERLVYYTGEHKPNIDLRNLVNLLTNNETHIPNLKRITDFKTGVNTYQYILTRKKKRFI